MAKLPSRGKKVTFAKDAFTYKPSPPSPSLLPPSPPTFATFGPPLLLLFLPSHEVSREVRDEIILDGGQRVTVIMVYTLAGELGFVAWLLHQAVASSPGRAHRAAFYCGRGAAGGVCF